jgi:hypothetical protein
MARTLGHKGESCAEAIGASLQPGEVVAFEELVARIQRKGSWGEHTIWRHLMSCVVNLPPARHEWRNVQPFLFLHGDGRYELYDPAKHPAVISS